jgi:hypothetical protein
MDFGARNGGSSTTGEAVAVYTSTRPSSVQADSAEFCGMDELLEGEELLVVLVLALVEALLDLFLLDTEQNIISSSSTAKNSRFTLVLGHFKQQNLVHPSRCVY